MRKSQGQVLLPFGRSYWIAPRQLLGGFYPGDRDPAVAGAKLEALRDCGVTHIINLMETDESDHAGRRFESYSKLWREDDGSGSERRSIRDLSTPTPRTMMEILDRIDAIHRLGGCVYVHCWGGRGRTGTVAGCWLARHGACQPLEILKQATAHAQMVFGCVPETPQQRAFVQKWRAGQ